MKAANSAASSRSNESKSEIEEIQKKADEVTDESLQSTQRMVEYCEQAKEAGIKVIVQLDNQKEQLDRIQDGLTSMRGTLIRAAENLRTMERCCFVFPNPLKKSRITDDETIFHESEALGATNSSSRRTKAQSSSAAPVGYIGRITNDEREDQMEKNMETVSTVLTNLKNMAIDMETELGVHGEQVKLINNMAEANQLRVMDATRRTHDLTVITKEN